MVSPLHSRVYQAGSGPDAGDWWRSGVQLQGLKAVTEGRGVWRCATLPIQQQASLSTGSSRTSPTAPT